MDVKTESKTPLQEPKRSCKGCVKVSVCQIFRVEAEYLKKEFQEKGIDLPFQPDQLATLCKYFLPLSAVRMTTSNVLEDVEKP